MACAQPAKTLIVDDDPRMRCLIKEILVDMNCEILEGSTGEEAVAIAREQRPDWVIMDVEMPGMDGIAATRFIHQDDPERRVVIVSKHRSLQLREASLNAGACGYLLKQDLTGLRRIMDRWNPGSPSPVKTLNTPKP